MKINRKILDNIYNRYNRFEFIHPDPLEFLYHYEDVRDREIVGLLASSLAYGRVQQILKSVAFVLCKLGDSPYKFVKNFNFRKSKELFKDFRHRFTKGQDLANLLLGVSEAIKDYGSLNLCFLEHFYHKDANVSLALEGFVSEIKANSRNNLNFLLPLPSDGSACKRLNLYPRWMVRKDDVDIGGWKNVSKSKLILPRCAFI